MAIIALVCFAAAIALLVLYVGNPVTWISTDDKAYWTRVAASRTTDNSMFLYGAGGALLLCAILGCLSARTRYVVEF